MILEKSYQEGKQTKTYDIPLRALENYLNLVLLLAEFFLRIKRELRSAIQRKILVVRKVRK